MTNGWTDIGNTDVVLAMGGNPAENHPWGFKWALEARDENGAKLVTIDPRFTRTSAEDWARDGIYMNSADTGWVTYEQPQHIKREWLDVNDGPPLDVIDGAARIYDPIVRGIRDEDFEFGKLYVNYEVAPW